MQCLNKETINKTKLLVLAIALTASLQGCNKIAKEQEVSSVLNQVTYCNETTIIRSQGLEQKQIGYACIMLTGINKKFHRLFGTKGKPIADDNSLILRANVYDSKESFEKYAKAHFNMPTSYGTMYLEGYPDKQGNIAEFVTYRKENLVVNLRHEYVHYLDGRFNKHGDYCNGLHDDHAGPEFCASPNLPYPHLVWWTEGVAEYVTHGNNNKRANELLLNKNYPYALSEIFNTSVNSNNDPARIFGWGYFAVRFMFEQQREDTDKMLTMLREGNWLGYQMLVKSWGTSKDEDFKRWLDSL